MDNIRLFLSLPFQRDGLSTDYPDCVKTFRAPDLDRYLGALREEIVSAAYALDDCSISELRFGVGSFCHIPSVNLEALYRLVSKHYHLSPRLSVSLRTAPRGFDFYSLTAAKHLKEARIDFLTPCLDPDVLREMDFCPPEDILSALDTCFQSGYYRFTCTLSPRRCTSPGKLGEAISEMKQRKPGAFMFDSDLNDSQRHSVKNALGDDYHEEANKWLRNDFSIPYDENIDQIGCGLCAVTSVDDVKVKSTSDLAFYCDHPDEFDRLIHPLAPDEKVLF